MRRKGLKLSLKGELFTKTAIFTLYFLAIEGFLAKKEMVANK